MIDWLLLFQLSHSDCCIYEALYHLIIICFIDYPPCLPFGILPSDVPSIIDFRSSSCPKNMDHHSFLNQFPDRPIFSTSFYSISSEMLPFANLPRFHISLSFSMDLCLPVFFPSSLYVSPSISLYIYLSLWFSISLKSSKRRKLLL